MKILLVCADYPPEECGGGGYVAQELVSQYIRKGHEVTVIAGYQGEGIKTCREKGLEVFWVPYSCKFLVRAIPNMRYSLPPARSALSFIKGLDQSGYDAVHLFSYPAHPLIDIFGRRAKSRNIITTIHAYPNYFAAKNAMVRLAFNAYLKTLASSVERKTRVFTAISESTLKDAVEKQRIRRERISLIPNGIDLERYANTQYASTRQAGAGQKPKEDTIRFLTINRLVRHKSLETALRALRRLHDDGVDFQYRIVGRIEDKAYHEELVALVRKLGLEGSVAFQGFCTDKEKIASIKCADIYLAPSTSEGFGLTLLEAMAGGCLVIASDIKGHKDVVIDGKNGLLFRPTDPDDLYRRIKEGLPEAGSGRIVKNASSYVKEYDWSVIADAYLELYAA